MELPKTASAARIPTLRRETALPSSVGTSREGVGDDAVGDLDAGAEDAVGGDAEAEHALFDDPVVGGADGPDVDFAGLEFADEGEHFGEDVLLDAGGEEGAGGGAYFGLAEAVVHLNHLAADVELGDFAAEIASVLGVDPVGGLAGDQAGFKGPMHEAGTGIPGPKGAIAVEDGNLWIEFEDGLMEGVGRKGVWEKLGQGGLLLSIVLWIFYWSGFSAG